MECIDFFLTQKQEMVATYLPLQPSGQACQIELKVHYASKQALEEEK